MNVQKGQYLISTDKEKLDIDYIQRFLSKSYWAEDIPVEIVIKSIEYSICFGVYNDTQQVGFARVITDQATFAHLADVFIDEKYRGLGLSKWLMEIIMGHPELQGLRTWQLGTLDAHGLYAKFGFKPIENPERSMRISRMGMYKKKENK